MVKLVSIVLFAVASSASAGCGTDYEITEQNLTGTIGGTAWSFAAGETEAFLSQDDDYFAVLYAESFTTCSAASPTGVHHLILNIPKETGEWELGLSRNMTFVVQSTGATDNLIGTEGVLRVDSITADSLQGGIHARFNGDNEVDGTFTLAICPN